MKMVRRCHECDGLIALVETPQGFVLRCLDCGIEEPLSFDLMERLLGPDYLARLGVRRLFE